MGATVSSHRRRAGVAAAAGALVLVVAGCGGEEDFANEPRPPSAIYVTTRIDDQEVEVSPDQFGGGEVVFTISNQSDSDVRLTLVGTGPADNVQSGSISAGGTGQLQAELEEGEYEVHAGGSGPRPDTIKVGPDRPSSQNQLLQP